MNGLTDGRSHVILRGSPMTLTSPKTKKKKEAFDAATVPIVCTATYTFESSAEIKDHFEGRIERQEYGRYGNPTVRAAEEKLAALDAAEDCALFASGMAAITTALLALLKSGDHVVLTSDGYRRTRGFVTGTLARFGVETTIVPAGDVDAGLAAVKKTTRVILVESPTNPYLRVVDIAKLATARESNSRVKLLVDSTFATPVNQKPLEQGADLVLHSCTKYLGGHNDLLAGSVAGSADLISLIRESRDVLGAVLDPHAAYLLIRGLQTLALRVERQNATALELAKWLENQANVKRVYYPGIESHPDHAVAKRSMRGFGGVVTFVLDSDYDGTSRFVDACELAKIAPSLGGVDTLIEQPALMSYFGLDAEERRALGIEDGLVRLAVGIEDAIAIRADLERALAALPEKPITSCDSFDRSVEVATSVA
jgi:cystathionine gamma-synthase